MFTVQPTEDQEFFQANTAKFLADQVPVSELRRLRHDPAGFDPGYWRRGAAIGWTSLLVPEEAGGGSISGNGMLDLALVAYEFGKAAAPGPLLDTNLVALALSSAGPAHKDVVAGLLSGEAVASWCGGARIEAGPDGVVVNGTGRPVGSAGVASHLLVTGGGTQVLIPSHAAGVSVQPLQSVDQTRRFSVVHFRDVRVPASSLVGEPGGAQPAVERQLQAAAVILAAETAGAMQGAFDMTVQWAFDRYTFGRPLASYQALKHRFAIMKARLEASHALAEAAARAVGEQSPEAAQLASAAKAFTSMYGPEVVHECVQMHGGIGLTYEHDLHLFVRRVTLDSGLFGTAAEHRSRLADLTEAEADAAAEPEVRR